MKIKLHWGVVTFALLWALAAFIPPIREAGRTILSSMRGENSYAVQGPVPSASHAPIVLEWNLEGPLVAGWYYEKQMAPDEGQRDEMLRQWDELAARFPDQTWISAARVRAFPKFSLSNKAPIVPLKSTEVKRRRQFEAVAQIAARLSRREPDNAYWPWMEAGFRFILGQRTQGLAAMERAGKGTRFQDYVHSTLRKRLDWWKQHDTPTWSERMGIFYAQTLTHISLMRVSSNEASLEAARAHKQGDNLTAIRIETDVLRANALWRRDSDSFIGALVAESAGYDSLENLFGKAGLLKDNTVDARQKNLRIFYQKWVALTRANGQENLAKSADWLLESSVGTQAAAYDTTIWDQFGLVAPWGKIAVSVPIFLVGVFGVCFSFALVWVVGRLVLSRSIENGVPTRGQVAICANFTFWALVGVGLLLASWLVTTQSTWIYALIVPFYSAQTDNSSWPIANVALAALGCWLFPIIFINWKRGRRFRRVKPEREVAPLDRRFGRLRAGMWLVFFVSTLVVASNGRGLWDGTPFQLPISAPVALISWVAAPILELIRFRRSGVNIPWLRVEVTGTDSTAPRLWKWGRGGSWLVVIAGFYMAFMGTGADGEWPSFFLPVGLGSGIIATGVALFLGRKMSRKDGFFFRLAVGSAGVLSLVCSFAFLGLAFWGWPLRAELNRQLDHRLAVKEMDWMREQIAKNAPSSP